MDWFQIWIVDLDPVFLLPILTLQMLVWYCSSVSRISWRDHAGASWNQILFNKYKLIWHTYSQQHTPQSCEWCCQIWQRNGYRAVSGAARYGKGMAAFTA